MDLQKFEEAKRRMLRRLGRKGRKKSVTSALNCIGNPLEGKTMNTDKTMDIEDLFVDMERKDKVPVRKGRGRGKKSLADYFAEIKVRMVRRIYACSAERAKEIIDGRALERLELESETGIPL